MTGRLVIGTVVVGDPDLTLTQECPACKFDTMLTFPLTCLSEAGVSSFGIYRACVRCYDMANS